MQRTIDMFEDGFRKFQMDVQRNPKFAFCSPRTFERLMDGWMIMPSADGSVNVYGVNVRAREDHDDDGFTFG